MKAYNFISVVIPAFNEEKYLAPTLEALKKQDFPGETFEIIVVNNGSTDKTHEVAKSLGAKVIDYSEKKGVAPARQAGVDEAKGQVIAFTDADTLPPPNWLSTIAEIMKSENVVGVGGQVLPEKVGRLTLFVFALYNLFVRLNEKLGKPLLWGNNLAVRKEALEKVGGFNLNLPTSEDWDLSLRIQKAYRGRARLVYEPSLLVLTSSRKQQSFWRFLHYIWDGGVNYINIVLLGRSKSTKMISVR